MVNHLACNLCRFENRNCFGPDQTIEIATDF